MKKLGKVAIIGGGVMGTAIAARLLASGGAVTITVTSKEAEAVLLKRPDLVGATVVVGNHAAVQADLIIIAVKPVNVPLVYRELVGKIRRESLLVSVAAGVSLKTLTQGFRHERVVRSMPNLAAADGEGVTVWCANELSDEEAGVIAALFNCLGKQARVACEEHLDRATALFGSGPAFVYFFMEALFEAALLIGFPKDHLRDLIVQMVKGAVVRAERRRGVHFAELRDDVSSTGGTTVEGIRMLDENGAKAAIKKAVVAAFKKSLHLSGK